MRLILPLTFAAAWASVAAGAQSTIQLDGVGEKGGPNARAAERSLGPNARAAQRAVGPNGALARTSKLLGRAVHYPSCAAAGAVRATPIRRGEPGYGRHLDEDGDGVACHLQKAPAP